MLTCTFALFQANRPDALRQWRPLMWACTIADNKARKEVISTLLKYGADPALSDPEGNNAVALAVRSGQSTTASQL